MQEEETWPLPNGGMLREELIWFLKRTPVVQEAARRGRCVLCRAFGVGADALCEDCRPYLNDDERRLADAIRELAQ